MYGLVDVGRLGNHAKAMRLDQLLDARAHGHLTISDEHAQLAFSRRIGFARRVGFAWRVGFARRVGDRRDIVTGFRPLLRLCWRSISRCPTTAPIQGRKRSTPELALVCFLTLLLSLGLLAGVAKAVTVTAPSISGTAQEGQPLTVANSAPNPPTAAITDQWEVCAGLTCGAPVATGTSYTPSATDVGQTIVVTETATDNSVSPAETASATSAPTAPVLPAAPVSTSPPTISGLAQQGQVLSVVHGTWTNAPTSFTDTWRVCTDGTCSAVFTGATFLVTAVDVGHTIEVVETATNAGGSASATSTPAGPALPAVPMDATAPFVSGSPEQGQTLALTQGVWTSSPTSIVDQWVQCDPIGTSCTPLPGQAGPTYTPGPGDVGHTLAVLETASNAGGTGPSAMSARTRVVTAPSVTSLVVVSTDAPSADQTVTLVATVSSSSSNANPSGSLTFFNGASGIGGCLGKPVKGGQSAAVICQTSFPAGAATISAAYLPGPGSLVTGSTSPTTPLLVGKDSTSVSLAVTKHVPLGTRATYSATLALPVSNSGPVTPTGSIEFLDHGQPIKHCLSEPLIELTATCRVMYRSPGAHSISASYDGDPNFAASTSSTSALRVVRGSRAGAVLGFVASTLQWTFGYHPTYSQVIFLKAFGIAPGTRVVITCRGGGCPFKQLRDATPANGVLDLLPAFRHRRLRAGSIITVRFMHPHWIGKYYSFTVRGGQPPIVDLSCLAVNGNAPGVGC
jgi:hypothetical protein